MANINVDGICKEIIWYSTKRSDGTYRIPIVLDFDFTCTKKSSWLEGTWEENPHCFETLKKWADLGCVFILDTMRGVERSKPAIKWLMENGISLYGVGRNPDQDSDGDTTPKAWGIYCIDDRNVGTFLVHEKGERGYVDWKAMDEYLTPILKKIVHRLPQMELAVLKEKESVNAK